MATTTNYGWTTPDDTDLVKDGAAAIRTLGSSVDTTTKALNPSTTLGDIEYRSSTADTNTRLPLGTANQLLRVNSGATAPEWATISTGSLTSIASGSLSGSSVDLTGISQDYTHLQLVLRDYYASNNFLARIRLNNGSGATDYRQFVGSSTGTYTTPDSAFYLSDNVNVQTNTQNATHAILNIFDYTETTTKTICQANFGYNSIAGLFTGYWIQTDNIDQINIAPSSGTWSGGTYILYGVK
jgi:hypothetical protein